MVARPTGQVLERNWKSGCVFALRFSAYGERRYLTLGTRAEGWNHQRAEEELTNVLADVRRGLWVPPVRVAGVRSRSYRSDPREESFGAFAHRVVEVRRGQFSESYDRFLDWGLSHTLPYYADWRLSEIDVQAIDEFCAYKVAEAEARREAIKRGCPQLDRAGNPLRPLSALSINKCVDFLQWVLTIAVEYGRIDRNPAKGRRRRLPVQRRPPAHLSSAAQIETLLEAARALDRDSESRIKDRLPQIATLLFTGLRVSEFGRLRWRDVDLANARIRVRKSKTAAGQREITMLPCLRDHLGAHKAAAAHAGPDDLVFPTRTGAARDKDAVRNRILRPVVARANELLESRGQVPLPEGLSPHKLRHTFTSILIALGEDPASVMLELGHTDPTFTLRVYTHVMRRSPGERDSLRSLVYGGEIGAARRGAVPG